MNPSVQVPDEQTLMGLLDGVDANIWLHNEVYPDVVRLLTEQGEVDGADLVRALLAAGRAAMDRHVSSAPGACLVLTSYTNNFRRYIAALAEGDADVCLQAHLLLARAELALWCE